MEEQILKNKILAIDFDSTIAHYDGWKGAGIFGEPIPNVHWALKRFKDLGAMIIIHTCRRETQHINDYLHKHKIPYDFINFSPRNEEYKSSDKKINADMYIDDRGISFQGDWKTTYLQVVNFRTWEQDSGAISSKG